MPKPIELLHVFWCLCFVTLSAAQEPQWTPVLIRQLYAADRAKAEAENLVQRTVLQEITLPNNWKVTLWSVSFPTSTLLSSRDLAKAYFREELTMTDLEANGQPQLVYAGDDERSTVFNAKSEGFKLLNDARSTVDGAELLLDGERADIVLMRLKTQDGGWEYESHTPIYNTATANHTATNRKLIGDGKIQVEWGGLKRGSVFDVSKDGVIREDGTLYRPPLIKYAGTKELEEDQRFTTQWCRETTRERLAALGLLKAAPASAATQEGGQAPAGMAETQSKDVQKHKAGVNDAAADKAEEHERDDSLWIAIVGISALLAAAMIILRHLKKRGA